MEKSKIVNNEEFRMKMVNMLKIYGYYDGALVKGSNEKNFLEGILSLDDIILDKKDFKELGKWREYNKLEICNNCPLYAECIKPTHCKEMSKCDEFTKERLINQHKKGIIYLYNNPNNNILNYKRLNENVWT